MRSLILALVVTVPLSAQPQPDFEQILVPFDTMTLPSGNGDWRAELWVRNESARPVNVWAEECSWLGQPASCGRRVDIPSGRTMLLDLFESANAEFPGVVLYVRRERSADVTFNLRVRDLNRGLDDIGTELPVVREAEMKTGTTTLINVPLQPNGRVNLRLYAPDPAASFVVRMYAEPSGDLLAERTYVAVHPTDPPFPTIIPVTIDASSVFRGWIVDRVRVTVERTSSSQPYWPLLTITNRRNNQITTVTPQ